MVPAQTSFMRKAPVEKRFLICIQYYDGDRQIAEEVASLICDLERTRNHEADILLVRRADAQEFTAGTRAKLEAKFDRVSTHVCRQLDGRGWPFGCNSLAYDLFDIMANTAPYRDKYYAFIPLEPDVVPTREGWISELITEWKQAHAEGFSAIGYIHDNPRRHVNGVAVWSADTARAVPGKQLRGGSAQIPWDVRHADLLLPLTKQTSLISFKFRRPTITSDELFATGAAIYHGVKDSSARIAVRDKFVAMKKVAPLNAPNPLNAPKRTNVYTYFQQLTGTSIEDQAILDTWRQGWSTRGWNPVILSERDAIKHQKFAEYGIKIEKLPVAGDKNRIANKFFRWLALDQVGGGLMVDYDALPGEFTPERISLDGGPLLLRSDPAAHLFGIWMNRQQSADWIKEIMSYDAQPDDLIGDKPHVSDDTIARRSMLFEFACMDNPPVKHFGAASVGNERKSVAMAEFLRGKQVTA